MDDLLRDKRFAHVAKDPKFKRIPQTERKVQVDKRFQSMFKDKRFQVSYTIDKRGRPISQTSSENLKKYYNLPISEEEDDEDEEEKTKKMKQPLDKSKSKKLKQKKNKKHNVSKSEESNTEDNISNENEDDDQTSDNCFSSNGELLRVKPKEETSVDPVEQNKLESESESDADNANTDSLKADLKESKKQLRIREKHESNKLTDKVKKKLKDLTVNYARGEGVLLTDSSSDEESSDVSDEEEIEHNWGELDKEADTTDEVTRRLAVCNMDWDRVRAVDLMVLFNSFLPSGGFIESVRIYPSEFGQQRMKEEEIRGPKELTQLSKEKEIKDDDDDDSMNEEGSMYHMEKLRRYQLNRLKYYYAVVEFNSAETANKIYTECDGTEYESTSARLDLRFIPDDMEFDQTPREVCDKLPELTKYQPRQFTTTALQQVKVHLTWDETNPERIELTQKLNSGKLDEINKNDLQAYLASDSDSDPEDKKEQKESQEEKSDSEPEENVDAIEKYKALLKEIEEKEEAKQKKDVELEFTWGLGTQEKAEKLVQERLKKDENLTPFEQYLEKRKAKKKAKREERKKLQNASVKSEDSETMDSDIDNDSKKVKDSKSSRRKKKDVESNSVSSSDEEDEDRRKAELELLLMDENDDGKRHFNMKKIEENATMTKSKQKRLNKKKNTEDQTQEDNFEVDVQDPRFHALFTSHHFNIDPADPHFRKTKGTEALIKEKLKRRADSDLSNEVEAKEPKMKPNTELQTLIKSVKKNAKNISRPIK